MTLQFFNKGFLNCANCLKVKEFEDSLDFFVKHTFIFKVLATKPYRKLCSFSRMIFDKMEKPNALLYVDSSNDFGLYPQ